MSANIDVHLLQFISSHVPFKSNAINCIRMVVFILFVLANCFILLLLLPVIVFSLKDHAFTLA